MKSICLAVLPLFLGQAVLADDCSDYPESRGVNVVLVEGGTKILSTAMASVPLDDIEFVLDAYDEAELEAKAAISKLLSEDISKECNTETATLSNIKTSSEGDVAQKSVNYEKLKSTLCSLSTRTTSLLRGAVGIGSCYTPGKFAMVTVGIKPETIAAAERLSNSMEKSLNSSPSTKSGDDTSTSTGTGGLTPMEGSSDTSNLNDF
jgi:hypothetical protein